MGGGQNYGPFLGYPKYEVPYYNKDPKRDHNFDNHPYTIWVHGPLKGNCGGSLDPPTFQFPRSRTAKTLKKNQHRFRV